MKILAAYIYLKSLVYGQGMVFFKELWSKVGIIPNWMVNPSTTIRHHLHPNRPTMNGYGYTNTSTNISINVGVNIDSNNSIATPSDV